MTFFLVFSEDALPVERLQLDPDPEHGLDSAALFTVAWEWAHARLVETSRLLGSPLDAKLSIG